MFQRRSGTALMAVMLLIVTACSSGGTPAPSTGGSSAAPPSSGAGASQAAGAGGDLVIWADDKRAAALKPLAAKFAADNGVNVKVEAISTDIIPKFLTASQAGTAPDIVVWAHDVIGDRKSTRLNSSHMVQSRMPSSA